VEKIKYSFPKTHFTHLPTAVYGEILLPVAAKVSKRATGDTKTIDAGSLALIARQNNSF